MPVGLCAVHQEPGHGRIVGAYPRLIQDGIRRSKYRRLCVGCARDLVAAHMSDWVDQAVAGSLKETRSCTGCGEFVDSNAQLSRFYITVYPDGKNRRDYAAAYCPTCTTARVREFELDG